MQIQIVLLNIVSALIALDCLALVTRILYQAVHRPVLVAIEQQSCVRVHEACTWPVKQPGTQ